MKACRSSCEVADVFLQFNPKERRTDILAQVQNVNIHENSTARITLLYEEGQMNGRK